MSLEASREQAAVADLLAHSPTTADHLLPLLQQVQAVVGFVSPAAMRQIALAFNLSRADVYGVVSFYSDLREVPVGRHVVQLCMAEACQAVGCRELAAHAQRTLGVELGQTSSDGQVHLEAAYCFGNCALGPTVRIGERIVGGVSPERFDQLMAELSDAPQSVERGVA